MSGRAPPDILSCPHRHLLALGTPKRSLQARAAHRPAVRVTLARLALVLVAASVLAVPALAQQEEACRRPVVEPAAGPDSWSPGQRFVMPVFIVNENEAPVESVTARLDVVPPPGWSASLARSSFTLGPENFTVEPLTITAPQRGTGLPAGDVVLTVHLTCHRAGIDFNAQTSVTFPVELTPARIPWLLLGAGLVAVLVVVSVVWSVRARLPRVSVRSSQPARVVPPGKGVQFPLVVGNRRREPDGIVLQVTDLPEGWGAHLAVDELELEPREERALWLRVRAPPGAALGEEHVLIVRAASRKHPREVAFLHVRARVGVEE